MKTSFTHVAAAAVLAVGQAMVGAPTQAAVPASPTQAAVPAATETAATVAVAAPPAAAHPPTDWIVYDDATYTPVLDDVSRALARARTALAAKDTVQAADAMTAAAQALQVQADRAGRIDRQLAAADMKLARDTHTRMVALTKKLEATADLIRSGRLQSTAALDKTLDKTARADMERRWLVTDVAGWYPVADEPQRHFDAAIQAFARRDEKAAAVEVRKAAAYVRLESARAVGDAHEALDRADAELQKTARALDLHTVKAEQDMDKVFADAGHALALAHRAKAAESWAHKAYDQAGYELKAAAQGLEQAAAWAGVTASSAAHAGVSDARAVGDKLARGGVWARDEVARGFVSLGGAIDQLGHAIGAKPKASPFDVGA